MLERFGRKASTEDPQPLSPEPAGHEAEGSLWPSLALRGARESPGVPLDDETRATFEPRFGRDFSDVRVHTGGRAAEAAHGVQASAYAAGPDIVFAEGQYEPSTDAGQHLIAHELAHVVHDRGGAAGGIAAPGGADERAADRAAGAVMRGERGVASAAAAPPSASIHRQPGHHHDPAPDTSATSGSLAAPYEMELESSLGYEDEARGELEVILGPRLRHERRVHVRTASGAEATVVIRGETLFAGTVTGDTEAALHLPGRAGIGYTFTGHLADGTPVSGLGMLDAENGSLADLAGSGPRFLHFGLTPEEQYQSVVDAMRSSVPEERWEESERNATVARPDAMPTQEQYEEMSEGEREDLFWRQFWHELGESFTVPNVLLALGAGIVLFALALAAAVAGTALAIGAFLGATVLALGYLIWHAISDLIDRIQRGEYLMALLGFLKDAALFIAVLAGAAAVVAIGLGGIVILGLSAPELAVIALAATAVALLVMVAMIALERSEAIDSPDVESFREHVRSAARSANEFIVTLIMTILTILGGRFVGGRLGPSGHGERGPIFEDPTRLPILETGPERPPVVDPERAPVVDPEPVVDPDHPPAPHEHRPPPRPADPGEPLLETPETTASRGLRQSDLEAMAEEFVERLPDDARGRFERNETVAIGLVEDSAGHQHLVYTVAQNRTSPAIRAVAETMGLERWTAEPRAPGRGSTGAPGDAEQLLIEAALTNPEFELLGVSATRPFCADCALAVPDAIPPRTP